MASLGHIAVGMWAGRRFRSRAEGTGPVTTMMDWRTWRVMAVFAGLALLPDLDYLGVMLGVANSGPCGHRGATHSLIFPMLAAAAAAGLAPTLNLPRWRTAAFCALAVASHALLDAMTMGSRGVPMLWPVSFHRFEMPWRPIPNAPCGLGYLSREGLRVASIELIQFLPILVLALRTPPRIPPPKPWPDSSRRWPAERPNSL